MKRMCMLMAMVMLLSFSSALSEEFSGKTAFLNTETVYACSDGRIGDVFLKTGEKVAPGDEVLLYETERVFADFDATVRGVNVMEGDTFSQAVFELEPKEKYKLLSSTAYAYDTPENKFVHAGETVYISCVKDATHLAAGYIAQVDNDEFTVYTTHGTLYVGEAVNIFRSPDRNYLSRIGRATVYTADNTAVEKEGRAVKVYVREGDRVEKGEVLMEYLPGMHAPDTPVLRALTEGIVTEVFVKSGDSISKGDKIYEYAIIGNIGMSFEVLQADMLDIALGSKARIVLLMDAEETVLDAAVFAINPLSAGEDARYEVLLKLDQPPANLREGLTAVATIGNYPE